MVPKLWLVPPCTCKQQPQRTPRRKILQRASGYFNTLVVAVGLGWEKHIIDVIEIAVMVMSVI